MSPREPGLPSGVVEAPRPCVVLAGVGYEAGLLDATAVTVGPGEQARGQVGSEVTVTSGLTTADGRMVLAHPAASSAVRTVPADRSGRPA